MVKISLRAYRKLKEASRIDWELVATLKASFEDVKHGRIKEVFPRVFQ